MESSRSHVQNTYVGISDGSGAIGSGSGSGSNGEPEPEPEPELELLENLEIIIISYSKHEFA